MLFKNKLHSLTLSFITIDCLKLQDVFILLNLRGIYLVLSLIFILAITIFTLTVVNIFIGYIQH